MVSGRIVIAGTGSGVGKTTLTIGIMAALQQRGLVVQGFKCGPDYIDPTYHTAVTGRPSRNLDSWMTGRDGVKTTYLKGSQGADISIIEGVMGMYDGKNHLSDEGSTADISRILDAPVILVVNIASMARSAAAIVKGFQLLQPACRIAGVIVNHAGSAGHYKMVKEATEQECGIPVIGWMPKAADIALPERHLGLVPFIERGELDGYFQKLAEMISAQIDLDQLLQISSIAAALPDLNGTPSTLTGANQREKLTIAIAKDSAFHFYYPENIELLESSGAECIYFSPLAGEEVPANADGLYIGGGFPEEFAQRLAANVHARESVRTRIADGLPTLAECGGFMFLTEELVDSAGAAHPMVGVIPGRVVMQRKLAALGYREVEGVPGNFLLAEGEKARGHEFHYSTFHSDEQEVKPAFHSKGRLGTKPEGIVMANLVAGYTHLHFASNPQMVGRWLDACAVYRDKKKEPNQ
ncbi:cobyrinate a,c-diamide synthase [Paenibacillus hexagrammi]|uniref:Cobyrinate a,c-diamide synthase n=1 Tax=Paenibacillus hexagrammi TaxID=2908839 RepID=A0ABY3SQM8_9BACL|nr:cobyrinate a,c-diamide synthase [Paenibacillus sp. YPD9-1]UJF36367.1 cobyrinate a,c-diamide synthase [Paenibacillus sp. YPD9-1]